MSRKVIVMSCPEIGTIDPYGGGPYDQPVMEKVQELAQLGGAIKMGFDRAGTTTAVKEDKPLFEEVGKLAKAGDTEGAKAKVRETAWLYGYITAAKRTISVESQDFDGLLVILCIEGGMITQVRPFDSAARGGPLAPALPHSRAPLPVRLCKTTRAAQARA